MGTVTSCLRCGRLDRQGRASSTSSSYAQAEADVTVPISSFRPQSGGLHQATRPSPRRPPTADPGRRPSSSAARLPDHPVRSASFGARQRGQSTTALNGTRTRRRGSAELYNGVRRGWTRIPTSGATPASRAANILNDLNLNNTKEDTPRGRQGPGLPGDPGRRRRALRRGEASCRFVSKTPSARRRGHPSPYLSTPTSSRPASITTHTFESTSVPPGNGAASFIFNNQHRRFLNGKLVAVPGSSVRLGGLTSTEAAGPTFAGRRDRPLPPGPSGSFHPNLRFRRACAGRVSTTPTTRVLNQNDKNPNGSFKLTAKIPDANKQFSPRSASPGRRTRRPPCASRPAASGAAPRPSSSPALTIERSARHAVHHHRPARSGRQRPPPTGPALSPGWAQLPGPGRRAHRLHQDPDPGAARGVHHRLKLQTTPTPTASPWVASASLSHSTRLDVTYARATTCSACATPTAVRRHDRHGRPSELQQDRLPLPLTTAASPRAARTAARATIGITGTFNRRLTDNFSFFAAVTWSQDKDNDSNERTSPASRPRTTTTST